MNYCPFISYGKEYQREKLCMENHCIFWDGGCLIVKALEKYTRDSSQSQEQKKEIINPPYPF